MASNTQETEARRLIRRKNHGKDKKAARRNKGTTPKFPLHTKEADKNAPAEAKKSE